VSPVLLVLLPLAGAPQQPPAQDPPSAARSEARTPAEAARELREALAGDDVAAAVAAVRHAGERSERPVLDAIAEALGHAEPSVRLAAVEVLRFHPAPEATSRLVAAAEVEALRSDPYSAAAWALALGQRGDLRALPLLTAGLDEAEALHPQVVTARLLALGRLADRRAADAVMAFLAATAPEDARHLSAVRLAMAALTGADVGRDRGAWLEWWREHRDDFVPVPPERPLPDPSLERRWRLTWMSPAEKEALREAALREKERARRRERRSQRN